MIEFFLVYIWPIIVFLLVFSLLVLIHEWGHFYAARKFGVKVHEFGFGFPPRIWGKKKGDTLYSINLIPFGGFVKLHGEDSTNPKMLKDPESFASKPVWQRMIITLGGVFMNFVLAIVALTIGFTVGMEPLIVDTNDFYKHLEAGGVVYEVGLRTKKEGTSVLPPNVRIIEPSERAIIEAITSKTNLEVKKIIWQDNAGDIGSATFDNGVAYETLDAEIIQTIGMLPQKYVYKTYGALQMGDKIVESTIGETVDAKVRVDFLIERDGKQLQITESFLVDETGDAPFIVEDFSKDSKAQAAGISRYARITKVNDEPVTSFNDFKSRLQAAAPGDVAISYVPQNEREESVARLTLDADALIGIYIAPLEAFGTEYIVYNPLEFISVYEIKKEQFPVHKAFVKSFSETKRLAILTVQMFGNVVNNIFTQGSVPQEIAGPIGIASMTAESVKQGAMAVLRFIALLSLSLAVLNILPIPALDGGRFLFQIVEAITGRRANAKLEAIVHGVGFLLLISLIIFVSFFDVLKLLQ